MRGLGRGVFILCRMGGALWNERAWKFRIVVIQSTIELHVHFFSLHA
jgi:hypothetical protein